MVGIPGRSKGCNTCRRRKKGCDLQRPHCGQCLKSGISCAGYVREAKFINYSTRHEGSHPNAAASEIDTDNSKHSDSDVIGHRKRNQCTSTDVPVIQLPVRCEQSAHRLFWYETFLGFYLPKDDRLQTKEHVKSVGWITEIPNLSMSDSTLVSAFDALATARLAKITNERSMQNFSYFAYGKALHELQKALRDPGRATSTETFASIMVLGLYEVYGTGSTDQSFGWTSHISAASSLIRLKGKTNSSFSKVDQELLLGCRLDRVVQAIGLRSSSYLVEPDWTVPPWSSIARSPTHDVLDIMALLPSVMEESDALREYSDISTTVSRAAALAKKCRQVAGDLEQWHNSQEKASPGPRSWQQPSTLRRDATESPPDEDEYYLEHCLWFPNYSTAYSELLYSTSLLLLYSTHCMNCIWLKRSLGSAISLLPKHDDAFSIPENLSLLSGAKTSALDIAMSLEYFIKPDMGGVGVGLIGFPISVAMGFFRYCNYPEVAWFDTVLKYVRREHSIPLDTFLESMSSGKILKLVREP